MEIVIIAAVASNGVIGHEGKIPWSIPADMKRFRNLTLGHAVIMGRRTWESIPAQHRPLKGRRNIVVSESRFSGSSRGGDPSTRLVQQAGDDVWWVNSLATALVAAEDCLGRACVIGGARIYEHALPHADALELTHVCGHFGGDTSFPYLYSGWADAWIAGPPSPWLRVSADTAPSDPLASNNCQWLRFEREKPR